jgi:hypothetical protein
VEYVQKTLAATRGLPATNARTLLMYYQTTGVWIVVKSSESVWSVASTRAFVAITVRFPATMASRAKLMLWTIPL